MALAASRMATIQSCADTTTCATQLPGLVREPIPNYRYMITSWLIHSLLICWSLFLTLLYKLWNKDSLWYWRDQSPSYAACVRFFWGKHIACSNNPLYMFSIWSRVLFLKCKVSFFAKMVDINMHKWFEYASWSAIQCKCFFFFFSFQIVLLRWVSDHWGI